MKNSSALFIASVFLLCGSTAANAHRLNVFAYSQAHEICVETSFQGGKPARGADVRVLTEEGTVFLTAKTEQDVKVCTVVGFPLGMSDTRVKAFETRAAIEDGAQEVDMVINVGALKDGKYDFVRSDIQTLKEVCGKDIVLKVIIETCLLTDEEKVKACELAKEAGADFVKTSTGFSTGGAKAADVALMRKTVGPDTGVKASGGIHNADEAQAMVDAGASRLGTSATLAIIG